MAQPYALHLPLYHNKFRKSSEPKNVWYMAKCSLRLKEKGMIMAFQPRAFQGVLPVASPAHEQAEQAKGLYSWTPLGETELTVIVPTKNEADNIEALMGRLNSALPGLPIEIIFVDDSDDNTADVIRRTAPHYRFNTKVISRPPQRQNGLGKAVVEGMKIAQSEWIVVMDGDLQHPPEVIPHLMEKAQETGSNLVVTSRLAEGGGTAGLTPQRKFISQSLAAATRTVFPQRLRQVTDPLTGFFLFKRDAVDTDVLQPEGFKILLEILIRSPHVKVSEVPFEFGERNSGESKADAREFVVLMRQMMRLTLLSQRRLAEFILVGLSGLIINTLMLMFFTEMFSVHYLVSMIIATQASTAWNFTWTERWVFADRNSSSNSLWMRFVSFLVLNNALLLVRAPLMVLAVSWMGMHYAVANVFTLVILMLVRFTVSDHLIWKGREEQAASQTKSYLYNIHDLVHVRSTKQLPELAYFKTDESLDRIDVNVRIENNPMKFKRDDSICYQEFLGRFGFSVVINRTEELTEVIASPLVGWSPHVLYTNAVEPILRWVLVRKDCALMHGATIAFGDDALFITAQTDTGKTTTVLHTVRNNHETGRFLADDMTIVSPDGTVANYPKPLTISKHTLQAIGGAPLTRWEWSMLQVQSRVHSRSGRQVAQWIDGNSFPAATINAIAQIMIPPPKYMIERIIPEAKYGQKAKLRQIVVIERGKDYTAKMGESEKAKTLIANAEDAYNFPPYPVISHRLTRWGDQDLQGLEQGIVMSAVADVPATRMGSSCYDWYKRLPSLIIDDLPANGRDTSAVSGRINDRLTADLAVSAIPGD